MISRLAVLAAFASVTACAPSVPDSNPGEWRGVGFGDYDTYQAQRIARDRDLERSRSAPVPEEQVIASETLGVLNATRTGGQTVAAAQQSVETGSAAPMVATSAIAAQPATGSSNPDISDEQNFDAVASRQTIESDAERLRRLRQTRQEVRPQAVPDRPSEDGPNIVAYALSTSNQVGQQVYRRSGSVSNTAFLRACGRFATSDQAQEEFLSSGGPRNDRRGLDPDGDGFACYWDPTPFRAARGG